MTTISETRLKDFWAIHPDARRELMIWKRIVKSHDWKHPADVKATFGARVDWTKVASGQTVFVFDIANNKYRMIAAIHFDKVRLFVLRLFSHKEYDANRWKAELKECDLRLWNETANHRPKGRS